MPERATAFITFEGADGTGKSTQFAKTVDFLRLNSFHVLKIREPGGTPIGEEIRGLLLHGPGMDMLTELLLYMAARAETYKTVISQARGIYDFVIADRSIDSSVVYQGYARGIPVDEIKRLNSLVTDNYIPDVTYLLDLDSVLANERLDGKKDRIEAEGIPFQEKVRQGFLDEATLEPKRFVVIDASQSIDECFKLIKKDIYRRFSEY